ncbi:transposon protein, putative, CACTA, En/Spm sub-class [Cucumis melo var. makuwa]|uniref:Transposon protein, putative, CACTA, En/Spm sub-class n=1 Tax=Cucumis melo var. makuwa TaxID=1194695 RepID=A0A5A7SLB2_CUCMM|nr:transposon protein, putative, CACTA, En/Spm sub-class [Cucumis melo var. makuwa]
MSHDFFLLTMGPSLNVWCYNGCIVGGMRIYTTQCDSQRTTQNSGVMVIDERSASGSGGNNFYGVLDEMLDVQYLMEEVFDYLSVGSMTPTTIKAKGHICSSGPEVDNVENGQLNILEVIVSHQVDEHIEDDTLCKPDNDPTVVERPIVRHVVDDFIDDGDEQLYYVIIPSGFEEID